MLPQCPGNAVRSWTVAAVRRRALRWRLALRRRLALFRRFLPGRTAGRAIGGAGLARLEIRDIQSWPAAHEPVGVVEVVRGRQQVRVRPDRIPAADAARVGETLPDGRGLPEPARPELEPDQRGEGPFRRAAGGPAPPDRLGA